MLPAVEIGLRYLEAIGMETIHECIRCLSGWLLEQLLALRHSNGQPVVCIYGPITAERRGGTIAFNFCDPFVVILDCYAIQPLDVISMKRTLYSITSVTAMPAHGNVVAREACIR